MFIYRCIHPLVTQLGDDLTQHYYCNETFFWGYECNKSYYTYRANLSTLLNKLSSPRNLLQRTKFRNHRDTTKRDRLKLGSVFLKALRHDMALAVLCADVIRGIYTAVYIILIHNLGGLVAWVRWLVGDCNLIREMVEILHALRCAPHRCHQAITISFRINVLVNSTWTNFIDVCLVELLNAPELIESSNWLCEQLVFRSQQYLDFPRPCSDVQ